MRWFNHFCLDWVVFLGLLLQGGGLEAFDLSSGKQAAQNQRGRVQFERGIGFMLPVTHCRIRVEFEKDEDLQRLHRLLQNEVAAATSAGSEKKLLRALEYFDTTCRAALDSRDDFAKQRRLGELTELAMVLQNASRPPVPAQIDGSQSGAVFFRKIYSPVGRGKTTATNIIQQGHGDLSKCDPIPGSFWKKPVEIDKQDLGAGFGRSQAPSFEQTIFEYSGPKQSYGRNPGVEVKKKRRVFKLKFAEVSCEPFATRIFSALGYHVDVTDHLKAPRMRYDRKFFLEFNSRKSLSTRFTALGFIPIYHLELQNKFDPFDYVSAALFKDGTRCNGNTLRQRLLILPKQGASEGNFRAEVESAIDCLVLRAANVQEKDKAIKSLGAWDFNQLGHADLRELRGAGLLAAWLGWFDTRFDNTRLKLVRSGGEEKLEHYISDLGGVLGETSGFLYSRGEMPRAFPWSFTAPGDRLHPLRIVGYKPVEKVEPFARMTIDDARWMARMMAQLTEPQIMAALEASGYGEAEKKLYRAKLLHRRAKMLVDLGLASGRDYEVGGRGRN